MGGAAPPLASCLNPQGPGLRKHLECSAGSGSREVGGPGGPGGRGETRVPRRFLSLRLLFRPPSELTLPQGHCPLCPRRCVRLSYQDFGRKSEGEEAFGNPG